MKIQGTLYIVLILATSTFFCHCTPVSEPVPVLVQGVQDTFEKEDALEMLNAVYQNLHTMQETSSEHNIGVDNFNVGYEVVLQIKAPDTGVFALNLYDGDENIVLHIVARYDWLGERNILVLNTFQGGLWGSEVRPSGFDFKHGICMTLNVVAESDGFHILQNSREIVDFRYRPGLPVTSVRRINVVSFKTQAAQDIDLTVKFN